MPLPPPLALDALLAARPVSLFLDFDGTLVELAPGPDEVRLPEELFARLADTARRLDGRLAVVSGRSVEWLRDAGLHDHVLSGTHGSELLWPGGEPERRPRPLILDTVDRAFRAFADTRSGVIVEHKPLAAGLHFRKAPEHGEEALALAHAVGRQADLAVQGGKMMVEVRVPDGTKGSAVAALMGRRPFAGSMPVFLGDDVTDEDGFAAAAALGGFGIAVGERESASARFALPGVAAVLDWLGS
ncbi:trehalose-phosphatase [Erythrobacteraceae bacterium CFH 75059]|uniref:trehalose-phosphatase n=1 Tax=Qipengyuania thermophila TaxID=2509361 RepID=UPI00101EFCD8|nr:trehalose-phosphatase [Qipengyuania thermophila]TCD02241.1 trehalose-phosphatase [Erythrobacteraceae bacterium CFH 75059]